MICRLDTERHSIEPCSIIILGASGDLTSRKLIPSLYHLHQQGLLPDDFRVIGFARSEKSDESWRHELRAAFKAGADADASGWEAFAAKIRYCRGDLNEEESFQRLKRLLSDFDWAPMGEVLDGMTLAPMPVKALA